MNWFSMSIRWLLVLALSTTLAACGGSGDSAGAAGSTATGASAEPDAASSAAPSDKSDVRYAP